MAVNPVRTVTKLGIDNRRKDCTCIPTSQCVVMRKSDNDHPDLPIMEGETLNDTLSRMMTTISVLRRNLKVAQSEIATLKSNQQRTINN